MSQQQVTVESPITPTWSHFRSDPRSAHRQAEGQRAAAGDRRPSTYRRLMAVSDDTHTGAVQAAGPQPARTRRRPFRCGTTGCLTGSRFAPRRRHTPISTPSHQKAFDANCEGEEDVNGLTTYRFTQNVSYTPEGSWWLPLNTRHAPATRTQNHHISGDGEAALIERASYYAAQRTFWVDGVRHHRRNRTRQPLLRS